MSTPDKKPIPFDLLSCFDKPGNCDIFLSVPSGIFQSTIKTKVTLGCRKGDPNIYYTDTIIAGNYPLPKPLEELTPEELLGAFPQKKNYVVDRTALFRLWNLAQQKNPHNQTPTF